MTRVACVGLAVLDLVFEVPTLPSAAGKHFAHGLRQVSGGPAANGAVTVARLGGEAVLVAAVGDDAAGSTILAQLRSEQVDLTGVTTVPGATSPTSAVLVDVTGERLIVNHLDAALHRDAVVAPGIFDEADAVLADLRWKDGATLGLQTARDRGVPAVLDYDATSAVDDRQLIRFATHIAFAQQALAARTATDDAEEGLRRIRMETDAWLAVTLGGDGVVWLDPDGTAVHLPAFDVEVVETLGAGDVFHGALALHLAEGTEEATAVRLASAAAALKCTRPGGRAGIPHAAEVHAFLKERSS
jgi:sulfofructose kinase